MDKVLTGRANEAAHWYTLDGRAAYEVPKAPIKEKCQHCGGNRRSKAGKEAVAACVICDEQGYVYRENPEMKPTTITDARKLLLLPSTTTVTKTAANHYLDRWIKRQVAMAAREVVAMHPTVTPGTEEWFTLVEEIAAAKPGDAAELGSVVHEIIERWVQGRDIYDPMLVSRYREARPDDQDWRANFRRWVEGARQALIDRFGTDRGWEAEVIGVSTEHGFACKVDIIHRKLNAVLDWKGRDWDDPSKPPKGYWSGAMQLGSNREALGMEGATLHNGIFSRTRPGLVSVWDWSEEDAARGWEAFRHLLRYWQIDNNFDTRFLGEATTKAA